MTPEEIAAALERWQAAKEKWCATGGREWSDLEIAGDAIAGLLSAANPPAGAERATEAVVPTYTDDTSLMLEFREPGKED